MILQKKDDKVVEPRKRIQWSYTIRKRVYEILVRIEINFYHQEDGLDRAMTPLDPIPGSYHFVRIYLK